MYSTICAVSNCPTPEAEDYINAACGHEVDADSDPKCSVCGDVNCPDCLEYNSGMCQYCRIDAEKEDEKIKTSLNLILGTRKFFAGAN